MNEGLTARNSSGKTLFAYCYHQSSNFVIYIDLQEIIYILTNLYNKYNIQILATDIMVCCFESISSNSLEDLGDKTNYYGVHG